MPEDKEEFEEKEFLPTEELPEEPEEGIWYRTEFYKALEKILEDKFVEDKLKESPLWSAISKSLKLTFFDIKDIAVLENLFEAEVCRYLRSLPPSKQNLDTYLNLGQIRMIFMANIRRSLGTNTPKINERTAILSQWKLVGPVEFTQPSRSLFGRIFGRREE